MLADRYAAEFMAHALLPRDTFHPFPTVTEREAWMALPEAVRAHEIALGEKFLNYNWPALPATLYLEFARMGNRSRFEAEYFARRHALGTLVIAECLEGQGRFLDDIVNGIWAICEESSWVFPAHNNSATAGWPALPSPDEVIVDLFAAETGALLSWTYYLLKSSLDTVTDVVARRIECEVQQRIIQPYLERVDYWWMGLDDTNRRLNNWTPWCNSNCLAAVLLLESDTTKRTKAVGRALRSLDRFLTFYYADGGCDEGPSYWGQAGGALFDCLEFLYLATNGAMNFYDIPLVGEIGRFMTRAHISGRYFTNFADSPAKVNPSANLLYRYGTRIGDAPLRALGIAFHHDAVRQIPTANWCPMFRALPALFDYAEISAQKAQPPLLADAWLPGMQFMTAREKAGSDRGFFLAAKGGHNFESHNHNDVGQFIVYLDGRPIIVDVGVEAYTAKTFSPQRYEIWTMQSAYHNLPTVNGVQQQPGQEFAASEVTYCADAQAAELSLDIATAYQPEAGITHWQRTCRLAREQGAVEVTDAFSLTQPSQEIVLSLMTPCEPQLDANSIVLRDMTGVVARVTYPADQLAVSVERIPIDDANLTPVWGDHLYRLLLRVTAPVQEGILTLTVVKESVDSESSQAEGTALLGVE